MIRSSSQIGGVIPSTIYRMEAYGPVPFSELRWLYKKLLLPWDRDQPLFKKDSFSRFGELMVPVASVWSILPNPPKALQKFLTFDPLWADSFHNLVVNTGLDDLLDKRFKASGYSAADYVGLAGSAPTFAASDTMSSHVGWTEVTAYSQATRPALTLGSVASQSVDNSASKAAFSINGTTTVGGSFVTTVSTKGGSTGILYGGGALAEGDRSLINGDSLSIQMTLSAAAS